MSKNIVQEILETIEAQNNPTYFRDFNGRLITTNIKSEQSRSLIISTVFENRLGRLSSNAIESTLDEMYSKAFTSEIVKKVNNRTGKTNTSEVVVDLGDNGFCIINEHGYQIKNSVDIPFHRPNKMVSLPLPKSVSLSEFLGKFKSLFNFELPDNYLLALAFILKSYLTDSGAYVILVLQGSQGVGKTTSSNNIKKMIDPTCPLLFSPPSCQNDLLTIAHSSHLLAFDNISYINAEMADYFCRLSTGGGVIKRGLYTDDEERSYDIMRPMLFNGIDELTGRADFLDRAVVITLKKLLDQNRKSESKLKESFDKDYPYLMGGIFTLLSLVLKELPNVREENLPRMTEFARIGIAMEKVLKLEEGSFLTTYRNNINEKSENAFWSDDVCSSIHSALTKQFDKEENPEGIKGTLSDIRNLLKGSSMGKGDKFQIAKSSRSFRGHLTRVEPLLNSKGIIVLKRRTAKAREIEIRFTDEKLESLRRVERGEEIELEKDSFMITKKEGQPTHDIDYL